MRPTEHIERFPSPPTPEEVLSHTADEFRLKLEGFGMESHEIDLVIARCYEGKTFQEISKEYGWVNVSNAAYHWKRILAKLRERGFR